MTHATPQARRRAERGAPLWAALAQWPRPCHALAAARGGRFAVSRPVCPLSRVFRVWVEDLYLNEKNAQKGEKSLDLGLVLCALIVLYLSEGV